MLKKTIGVAFAAAAGLILMGGPANAGTGHHMDDHGGMNNSTELIPIQLCNDNLAVLGVQVPIGSPQTNGDCVNGSVQEN